MRLVAPLPQEVGDGQMILSHDTPEIDSSHGKLMFRFSKVGPEMGALVVGRFNADNGKFLLYSKVLVWALQLFIIIISLCSLTLRLTRALHRKDSVVTRRRKHIHLIHFS